MLFLETVFSIAHPFRTFASESSPLPSLTLVPIPIETCLDPPNHQLALHLMIHSSWMVLPLAAPLPDCLTVPPEFGRRQVRCTLTVVGTLPYNKAVLLIINGTAFQSQLQSVMAGRPQKKLKRARD